MVTNASIIALHRRVKSETTKQNSSSREDTSVGARSTKSELMHHQMSAKRALDEAMMDKLVGTSKVLPILHFPRDLVLDSQGGGWTGVLLLTALCSQIVT